MNVAIVGYATEGVVSAAHWQNLGHTVTICDQNPELSVPVQYQKQLGPDYLHDLDRFDVIVRSAGIHPRILLKQNPNIASKITTNIEEFMRVCPSRTIIGVTGTKGKGTTSTLVSKMLEAAGKTCHLGGNIGIPALELLPKVQPDDYVVLELSSFQLEDFKGPSPHIGVCIMVVPEHLNWHDHMDEYIAAKANLFRYQTANDVAVYYSENELSKQIATSGKAQAIPYYQAPGALVKDGAVVIGTTEICKTSDIRLLGKHNWQNVCAAVTAVWQVTQDTKAIASVISSFKGLEHRIEFVRELENISYYDDSFATTPETSMAAIEAFDQPKVVILGGSDKGIPLDQLAKAAAHGNVRHVVTIGDMAETIKALLAKEGFTDVSTGATTMPAIVAAARDHAQAGDVVLLSTGCASFGLFDDYKDRGNQFKAAVQAL